MVSETPAGTANTTSATGFGKTWSAISTFWNGYWFPSEGTRGFYSVAFLRIFLYATILFTLNKVAYPSYEVFFTLKANGYYDPDGILKFFGPTPPSAAFFDTVRDVAYVSTWMALLGLFTRWSMVVSLITSLLLVSLGFSYMPGWYHAYNVVFLAQIAFVFARAGDFLSLDAVLKALGNKTRFNLQAKKQVTHNYLWSVYLVQWSLVLMFLNACFWKLIKPHNPFAWVFSDNMRLHLATRYYLNGVEPSPLVEWLMLHEWRYKFLAMGNILCQGMPILSCIFIKRPWIRLFFGSFFILELVGLGIIMGLWETHWIPLLGIFVDWDKFIPWMGNRFSAFKDRLSLTIYYDGDCGLCNRGMHVFHALDWFGLFRYTPIQALDFQGETFPSHVNEQVLMREMGVKLANGKIYLGFDAYVEIFLRTVLTFIPGLVMLVMRWIQPLRALGMAAYGLVARNRRSLLHCPEGEACGVDFGTPDSDKYVGFSAPWKPVLVSAFIATFLGYYCTVAFLDLKYKHNNYPFTSFTMYSGMRAKKPLREHQTYEVLSTRLTVEPQDPQVAPATPRAIHKVGYMFRALCKASDIELIHKSVQEAADTLVHAFHAKKFETIALHRVIMQVPAYPAHPRPREFDKGLIGYFDSASGQAFAASAIPKKDENGKPYLEVHYRGYKDPQITVAYIHNFIGEPKPLPGRFKGNRYYYSVPEKGRYVFELKVQDSLARGLDLGQTHQNASPMDRYLTKDYPLKPKDNAPHDKSRVAGENQELLSSNGNKRLASAP